MKTKIKPAPVQPITRVRIIRVPNPRRRCTYCGHLITAFQNGRGTCVCVNIYRRRKWDRTELSHFECYQQAGQPHGAPLEAPKTGHRTAG